MTEPVSYNELLYLFLDSAPRNLELDTALNSRHFHLDGSMYIKKSGSGKSAPTDFDELLQQARAGIVNKPSSEKKKQSEK